MLTETSYDRLTTIAQNNDLGAGMAVAMKDLEMRGAGNVLGAEQSGHIAGVGFDLYVRLVGEAVEAFRAMADGKVVDGTEEEKKEIRIDLPVDAHIPVEYVASERLRLEAYRKFAAAEDVAEIAKALRNCGTATANPARKSTCSRRCRGCGCCAVTSRSPRWWLWDLRSASARFS